MSASHMSPLPPRCWCSHSCPMATRSPEQNHQHWENYEACISQTPALHKCKKLNHSFHSCCKRKKKKEVQPSRLTKALKLGLMKAHNTQRLVTHVVLKDSQTLAALFLAPSIPGGSFRWEFSLSTQTNGGTPALPTRAPSAADRKECG